MFSLFKPLKQPGSNAFVKLTVVNGAPSSPLLQLNTGVDLSSNVRYTDCLAGVAL